MSQGFELHFTPTSSSKYLESFLFSDMGDPYSNDFLWIAKTELFPPTNLDEEIKLLSNIFESALATCQEIADIFREKLGMGNYDLSVTGPDFPVYHFSREAFQRWREDYRLPAYERKGMTAKQSTSPEEEAITEGKPRTRMTNANLAKFLREVAEDLYERKPLECTESIREAADRLDAVSWQSIETAPKDGTRILATSLGCEVHTHYWNNERLEWWIEYADGASWQPTHWMPMPNPNLPKAKEPNE